MTAQVPAFDVASAGTVGVSVDNAHYYPTNSLTFTIKTATPVLSVQSLTFTPSPATVSSTAAGTVTLTGNAPAGGATVTIDQNGISIGSVTVPSGGTSAAFTIDTGNAAGTVTYLALYNGSGAAASLTVNATSLAIRTLSFNPASVGASGKTTGMATLSGTRLRAAR